MKRKAGTRRGSQDGRTQIGAQAIRIVKREVERIIGNGAFALHANIGSQRLGHAEK